ncbi:MAG: hypothetical protein J1D99_03850, partial [Campylobacter sp.]|nr:hypothetical protein [Campylobacter sp.]
ICSFNETKLQNLIQNVKIAEQSLEKIINFFQKLYEKEEDENYKKIFKEITELVSSSEIPIYDELKNIESKFKEYKNE